MIDISDLNARALVEMAKRIQDDIAAKLAHFGAGGWINQTDVGATGMQAVKIQAEVQGLSNALKHIQEVDRLLTGKIKPKEKAA